MNEATSNMCECIQQRISMRQCPECLKLIYSLPALTEEIEHQQEIIDRVALIRLDLEVENKRLTTEVSELKRSYHERVAEEVQRIRDEFCVKEVHERRGGADYLLQIQSVYPTPEGHVVIVSSRQKEPSNG